MGALRGNNDLGPLFGSRLPGLNWQIPSQVSTWQADGGISEIVIGARAP